MNKNHIDQICLGYLQSFGLIFLAVCSVVVPFLLTSGKHVPPIMIGGGFAIFTWGFLHIRFRKKLTRLIKANTQSAHQAV